MKIATRVLWLALGLAACTTPPPGARQVADRWAQATVHGDHATTHELAAFDGIAYVAWQGNADSVREREQLAHYAIATEEQRGESTVFCVEYAGDRLDSILWHMVLHVNKHGQVVAADRLIPGACTAPQGGDHATR